MATRLKTQKSERSTSSDLPMPSQRTTKPINLQIRVSDRLLHRIQRLADAKELPASTMARILIMERLNELDEEVGP